MGKQSAAFEEDEGNNWFDRNFMKIEDNQSKDPILPLINIMSLPAPTCVMEFGCANGWRLHNIKKRFPKSQCFGVDPSKAAIETGTIRYQDIFLTTGTVTNSMPYQADLAIIGFCLYLCDREELFLAAHNVDQTVKDGGHLIIHDFDPDHPHKVIYHHKPGLFSYKMDYSKLWLSNPAYSLVSKTKVGDGEAIWILKKDQFAAWPEEVLK